jgi:hypothetical protein
MSAANYPDPTLPPPSQRSVPSSLCRGLNFIQISLVLRLATLTVLLRSDDFDLIVRQQPTRARVAGGKEKGT